MYAKVAELKTKFYAVKEHEQGKHAAALLAFKQATPNKSQLDKYLQHMRLMLQEKHAYIAHVAMHCK